MFDDRILSVEALPFLWPLAACALAAYLLGSVPFGLVLARMAGLGDIREVGSGNIGATNALRAGGKPLAAAVLLLDGGKGAAAVVAGFGVGGHDFAVVAALCAVVGHVFPVWLRFRGGKGLATYLGVTLGLSLPAGLAAVAVWLAVAAAVRISSVAGIASALAAPVALRLRHGRRAVRPDFHRHRRPRRREAPRQRPPPVARTGRPRIGGET